MEIRQFATKPWKEYIVYDIEHLQHSALDYSELYSTTFRTTFVNNY